VLTLCTKLKKIFKCYNFVEIIITKDSYGVWRVEHKNKEHIILYNINTEFYHINIIFNNKNEKK